MSDFVKSLRILELEKTPPKEFRNANASKPSRQR